MSDNYNNESFVKEMLQSVLAISEEKISGTYKVSGIKTAFKSSNHYVTVIGNIAVIDINQYLAHHGLYIDIDLIKYNPDEYELPVGIDVTQIGYTLIITGLDIRSYSVDNRSARYCSPESLYPNVLRHYGIHGFNDNHRFMVRLPGHGVESRITYSPVFNNLSDAVEFRSALHNQNKHKYDMFLEKEISIYYFDALDDRINNEDLIEFDDSLSFIKNNDKVFTLPLDIGKHEFYHDGIWLHPEGKNTGIIDSPDKYYHQEKYEINGKIYQADFLTIKRNKLSIPRGLLIEFLSYSKHVAKVKYGECLAINSLVDHFIKFIRNYVGQRNLAEKAYEIQDMLRDGALSNKAIAYHLNLGISDIINEHSAFTILDNDNRKDNDGFYIVPNVMSSYIRPMIPRKDDDRQVGVVFEKSNSIELPEGEYVLFKDIYFKRTLANMGSHFNTFVPLKLLVKHSEIGKYLANVSDENKNVIFPDNKLVYCNSDYGVETPIFNYITVDEILSYSGYEIVSNTDLDNSRTFKVAEGIYGFGTMLYEFTDSKHDDNPLEPFYEYIPD